MKKNITTKRNSIILIVLLLTCQGCAGLHYSNRKGLGAVKEDIQVKTVTVDEGTVAFRSMFDICISFFLKGYCVEKKISMDDWE